MRRGGAGGFDSASVCGEGNASVEGRAAGDEGVSVGVDGAALAAADVSAVPADCGTLRPHMK